MVEIVLDQWSLVVSDAEVACLPCGTVTVELRLYMRGRVGSEQPRRAGVKS